MNSRWRWVLSGGGVLLIAMAALQMWRPAAGAALTNVHVAPASQNVGLTEDSVNVEIQIQDAQDLGAFEVTLQYNAAVLEFAGAASGEFLLSTGRIGPCLGPEVDDAHNTVNFGCNTLGIASNSEPGPNGNGLLVTFAFKPRSKGDSPLVFMARSIEEGTRGTELASVESEHGQKSLDYEFTTDEGIIAVYDEDDGAPSALPSTPTKVPRSATPNVQATSAALLGTPVVLSGQSGGSGSGGTGGPRSGNIAPGGGATGPDGAPIAGYGPEEERRSGWPVGAGIAMALAGAALAATGTLARRKRAQGQGASGE